MRGFSASFAVAKPDNSKGCCLECAPALLNLHQQNLKLQQKFSTARLELIQANIESEVINVSRNTRSNFSQHEQSSLKRGQKWSGNRIVSQWISSALKVDEDQYRKSISPASFQRTRKVEPSSKGNNKSQSLIPSATFHHNASYDSFSAAGVTSNNTQQRTVRISQTKEFQREVSPALNMTEKYHEIPFQTLPSDKRSQKEDQIGWSNFFGMQTYSKNLRHDTTESQSSLKERSYNQNSENSYQRTKTAPATDHEEMPLKDRTNLVNNQNNNTNKWKWEKSNASPLFTHTPEHIQTKSDTRESPLLQGDLLNLIWTNRTVTTGRERMQTLQSDGRGGEGRYVIARFENTPILQNLISGEKPANSSSSGGGQQGDVNSFIKKWRNHAIYDDANPPSTSQNKNTNRWMERIGGKTNSSRENLELAKYSHKEELKKCRQILFSKYDEDEVRNTIITEQDQYQERTGFFQESYINEESLKLDEPSSGSINCESISSTSSAANHKDWYKIVSIYKGKYLSTFDGKTEFQIGKQMTKPFNEKGGKVKGGYTLHKSKEDAVSTKFPSQSTLINYPRAMLKFQTAGKRFKITSDCYVFETIVPIQAISL